MKKTVPVSNSFMIVSIAGFLISAYLIDDISWKFTMIVFFSTMFIASFISMTNAPIEK